MDFIRISDKIEFSLSMISERFTGNSSEIVNALDLIHKDLKKQYKQTVDCCKTTNDNLKLVVDKLNKVTIGNGNNGGNTGGGNNGGNTGGGNNGGNTGGGNNGGNTGGDTQEKRRIVKLSNVRCFGGKNLMFDYEKKGVDTNITYDIVAENVISLTHNKGGISTTLFDEPKDGVFTVVFENLPTESKKVYFEYNGEIKDYFPVNITCTIPNIGDDNKPPKDEPIVGEPEEPQPIPEPNPGLPDNPKPPKDEPIVGEPEEPQPIPEPNPGLPDDDKPPKDEPIVPNPPEDRRIIRISNIRCEKGYELVFDYEGIKPSATPTIIDIIGVGEVELTKNEGVVRKRLTNNPTTRDYNIRFQQSFSDRDIYFEYNGDVVQYFDVSVTCIASPPIHGGGGGHSQDDLV